MAKKDYKVSRSNYSIKKKHQNLTDHTIYERDYMITSNLGGWSGDVVPFGSANNFKVLSTDPSSRMRKHNFGDWLMAPVCDNISAQTEYWTSCNTGETFVNSENEIVTKPNYNSLLDFAFYGSCVELIKSSIKDIINRFPAELYVSDAIIDYTKGDDYFILGENDFENPILIENDFNVDIWSRYASPDEFINRERVFALSKNNYVLYDANNNEINFTWESQPYKIPRACLNNGDIVTFIVLTLPDNTKIEINRYYLNQQYYLITDKKYTNYHIRPKQDVVDVFFNSLDDFEKVLLNKYTNPLYTAYLDTPQETKRGVIVYRKYYTWPTQHKWNIDISSEKYNSYLSSLIKVSEFYDEYFTDNLWRNIAHDAIKNMDLTYKKENSLETHEDYFIGTSRLRGLLLAYGREFDDIKRSIDNIKFTSNISYNGNNNIPDYFLTDVLELGGWDAHSLTNVLPNNIYTDVLFSGENKKYNNNDASTLFLRELKLNSKHLLSKKGTRQGIESLLALFGLRSYDYGKSLYNEEYSINGASWDELNESEKRKYYDYSIDEFVAVASSKGETEIVNEDGELVFEKWNKYRTGIDKYDENFQEKTLEGLPLQLRYFIKDGYLMKYAVPWFDKYTEYDGKPYFQMFGGWNQQYKKNINIKELTDKGEIYSTDNFKLYSESVKYMHMVHNIKELTEVDYTKLNNNDIYYVFDIDTDFYQYFGVYPDEAYVSHYFTIDNKENYRIINRYITENDEIILGWKNIPLEDIKRARNDGLRVLYIESLIDNETGNNPHVGYGQYDNGEGFYDFIKHIFKNSIENNLFEDNAYVCETGNLNDEILNAGYDVETKIKDNMKCWYFTDNTRNNDSLLRIDKVYYEGTSEKHFLEYQILKRDNIEIGKNDTENLFESELIPYDFMNSKFGGNDETCADSVINAKNLKITFNIDTLGNGLRDYIQKAIVPYLAQIVPSTSILEIKVGDVDSKVNDNLPDGTNQIINLNGDAVIPSKDETISWNKNKLNNIILE